MTDPTLPIAVEFIAAREGFRSHPYRDQGGVWTIGYGDTVTPDGVRVTATTAPITQAAADARLSEMVGLVLASVRGMVYVPVSNNQVAALTSLAYNAGTNAVRTSTLLRELNQGNYGLAAQYFMSWVYAAGKVDPGLQKRREMEKALFLKPDDTAPVAPVEDEADRLDDLYNPKELT